MRNIILAFKVVFKDWIYILVSLSLAVNLLAVYYFIFLRTTTLEIFWSSNTAFYNWFSVVSALLVSLFFGMTMSFLIWQWKEKITQKPSPLGNSFIGGFLGAVASGCPVCGASLASLLGIGGGLAAFPFQGLEIKTIALGLMGFSLFSVARTVAKKDCQANPQNILSSAKNMAPALLGFVLLMMVGYLPAIGKKFDFGFTFQRNFQASLVSAVNSEVDSSEILENINPTEGFTVKASYGNLGPKLLASGVIDFEKMKNLYEQAGQPLTEDQIKILTEGSNEKIKITPENSYFLLNFFWALGLANKNVILDEGQMTSYGKDQIGNFASTGGWILGKKDAMEYYSKFEIIKLNSSQQAILDDFANNSYRPCCSNPVAFPDCNHGMAALALGELMASQGLSVDEIFDTYKYFNAFWFPQTYFDVATYFKAKEGKDWNQVDNRVVAGKDYSTPQGWQRVRSWLSANGLIKEAPSGGGGCGV